MKKILNKISPKNIQSVYVRRFSIIMHIPISIIVLLYIITTECICESFKIAKEVYDDNIPKAIENVKKCWNKKYVAE